MRLPKYAIGEIVKMRTYECYLPSKKAKILEVFEDNVDTELYYYKIEYDVSGRIGFWPETSLGSADEPDYPNIPFITYEQPVKMLPVEEPPVEGDDTQPTTIPVEEPLVTESVTQEEPPMTESVTQEEPPVTESVTQEEPLVTESVTQEEPQITLLVEETFNIELEEVTIELPTLTKQKTFRLNPLNY